MEENEEINCSCCSRAERHTTAYASWRGDRCECLLHGGKTDMPSSMISSATDACKTSQQGSFKRYVSWLKMDDSPTSVEDGICAFTEDNNGLSI